MSIIFKLDGKNVKQGQEEQTKRRTKDKDNIICSKSSSCSPSKIRASWYYVNNYKVDKLLFVF